ncbi:pyruvate dehydrogenase E2 component (dihydrolipoamide acetyltransferase) [Daejeonella rubra]|uniref:Dihydrolipoamide acetyltransferase component of pyruvate dehydrogenase complex n=1 Tax=Daejeonella rubra TaxID=990371 RepID=A0A1G9YLZ4_9SPHI|nr:dihydrolipoamide acetyltransferase family protein [Daejeonella rubra]SDN10047.1 pyruvate dehydrogenase E2 component (dihydrolipoamide acetyltransferase) [Daejeonella rubra]
MIEFVMPSLGADMADGTLVEWLKKPGDQVKRGDIIATVETQKGLIDIEVFDEGTIEKLMIAEDTKVPVGTLMALINPEKTIEPQKAIPVVAEEPVIQPTEEKAIPPFVTEHIQVKASPLAKKIAAENNIDLSQIMGSGENGAITRKDIEGAIEQGKLVQEKERSSIVAEPIKEQNISNTLRSAVAAAMSRSNREIPHYFLEKKIDLEKALAWMHEKNKVLPVQKRLLPVALLIKAVASSLKQVPELNAIWDTDLQLKTEINIGFVVSLRNGGIIVPAIHAADLKSVDEIMENLNDIIPRARALRLRSSELSDSTVTITSIGDGGADLVYGIIYPPQVAIIGFGSISEQAFAENGLLGVRPMVRVSLAGDHRASDGLSGSRFLVTLNNHLQNPEAL